MKAGGCAEVVGPACGTSAGALGDPRIHGY